MVFYLHIQIIELYTVPYDRSQWPRCLRRRTWPRGYWDREFESRSRHGGLFLYFYILLACVGRGISDGLITPPKKAYQVS
jgi:hypothetical protein